MAAQIEFKTKDLYHRYKRFILFLTSALIIIWCAKPGSSIPIPGTETTVNIATPVAFTMITLAILYHTWLFLVEWLAVRAINSSAVVRTGRDDIDQAVEAILKELKETTASFVRDAIPAQSTYDEISQIWQYFKEFKRERDAAVAVLENITSGMTDAAASNIEDHQKRLSHAADLILATTARYVTSYDEDLKRTHTASQVATDAFQATQKALSRLSSTISRTQGFNFQADRVICAACSAIAIFITVCEFLGRVPPF